MNKKLNGILVAGTLLTSGCASLPDATITYYSPVSSASLTVLQTVSCQNVSNPIIVSGLKSEVFYSANKSKPHTLNLNDLDTFYSSGDVAVSLTNDGRLQGFNSSSKGEGGAVIETSVDILKSFIKIAKSETVSGACGKINAMAGKVKGVQQPMSFTRKASVSFKNDKTIAVGDFKLVGYPKSFYDQVKPVLGDLSVETSVDSKYFADIQPVVKNNDEGESLTLLQPATVPLKVTLTTKVDKTLFTSYIPVPQWGQQYTLPIPKPPMFGTNKVEISINDSGTLKTIKYGKESGVGALGSSLGKLHESLEETDSEKAAKIKAEADVLAQQQRLVICQTSPKDCK